MKDETRVRGPWADKKIKPAYSGKDLPKTLWPWQAECLDRLLQEPDDRTINYIIDTKGHAGKSKFCKYMAFHHGALFLPWGKTGDILNYVCKNKDAGMFLFDLSRSKPQDWARDDISAAMEQIKNGMVVNLKFDTFGIMFDPPHVWAYSNQPPNLSSMSADRWKLWTVDENKQLIPWTRRMVDELRMGSKDRSHSPHRGESIDLSQE